MSNDIQNDCACEKTRCGCAGATPASRCECGDTCACEKECRCPSGCGCGAER